MWTATDGSSFSLFDHHNDKGSRYLHYVLNEEGTIYVPDNLENFRKIPYFLVQEPVLPSDDVIFARLVGEERNVVLLIGLHLGSFADNNRLLITFDHRLLCIRAWPDWDAVGYCTNSAFADFVQNGSNILVGESDKLVNIEPVMWLKHARIAQQHA